MDTPRSVVPGSESGQLLVSGGLALPAITKEVQQEGLTRALSSLTSLLAMQHLGLKGNDTFKHGIINRLPAIVSIFKIVNM